MAVNDLGLVAFGKAPQQYVLDLVGLGSAESARERNKSPIWLDEITREHAIGAVAIYADWFAGRPSSWTELGSVCLKRSPIALNEGCVYYYATGLSPVASLQQSFQEFARTVPAGDTATVLAPH